MVRVQVSYEGDLHCSAVHAPSEARLATDAPVDNQGRGESFSPTDLVATALGTCMLTIMGIVARRDAIPLEGATFAVEKHMSPDAPRRIARLPIRFAMPRGLGPEQRKKLENAGMACPVKKSLHPEIEVDVTFDYPD